jgi:cytochrome P450 family 103
MNPVAADAGKRDDKKPEPASVTIDELERDPHGVFRRYRKQLPFIKRADGTALVLRNRDVQQLLTDPRTRQGETEFAELRGIRDGTLFDLFKYSMVTSNGSDHRRRRSAFATAFAFRAINDLRPHIRKVADELIDGFYAEGEIDFLGRYASQLPARLIGHILGMHSEDIPFFTELVYATTRVFSFRFTAEELPGIENSASQLMEYTKRLAGARRAAPRDDFLSTYLVAADQAGEMSPLEILIQLVFVIIAASDTTRGALSVQTAQLLQHREQWDAVCRDSSLVAGAVAEALRFEPSVASVSRFALDDIELDGYILEAGQFMTLSTMSAMRDEEVFEAPDIFDIFRTDRQRWHLVFGAGAHRCLGEALARAELEEGLAALTARIPKLQLRGEPPDIRGHVSVRRVGAMSVHWPT